VAVEGIARDVTQRVWMEQASQESEERHRQRSTELVVLHGLSLRLNTLRDMADLLRFVVDQAVMLLGASAGGIYLYDEKCRRVDLCRRLGYAAEYVGRSLKPGEGLAGRVFASRQSMSVADYTTWPEHASAFDGDARLKALLAVPLTVTRTVLGVLMILGTERQVFQEHDVWLVEMLSSQAAVALENARLHAEAQRRSNRSPRLTKPVRPCPPRLILNSC